MTTERLQNDLAGTLRECDFVRYVKWDDEISFYVVADNEKDERTMTIAVRGSMAISSKSFFSKQETFFFKGEEADFYRQEKLEIDDGHLFLQLEGSSFDGTKSEVTLAFSFERFQVEDLGKIQGPDA